MSGESDKTGKWLAYRWRRLMLRIIRACAATHLLKQRILRGQGMTVRHVAWAASAAKIQKRASREGQVVSKTNADFPDRIRAVGQAAQAAAALADQPAYIATPLKKQLSGIEAALAAASPDAASRLRRLADSVGYIETMSGRPADPALARIRELAQALLRTHAVT